MDILQGEVGYEITAKSIQGLEQFALNTPGGNLFEGLAMYDYVNPTNIEVGCIGLCASAGTLPLLASKTRWGTPNSRYLIHNPWNGAIGEAKELEKAAIALKTEELRAVDIYEKHLSISRDEIIKLMNQDTIIDANEALKINLITQIKEFSNNTEPVEGTDVKSLYLNFKMKYEMEKKDETILKSFISEFTPLLASFKKLFVTKNIVLQDVNGVNLDFGNEVETKEQITVGTKVTANGQSTSETYVMPDGTSYVVVSGTVDEIKEPAPAENAEVEVLKAENETLQSELSTVKNKVSDFETKLAAKNAEIEKMKTEFSTISKKFTEIENLASGETPGINTLTVGGDNQPKKKFSFKSKN